MLPFPSVPCSQTPPQSPAPFACCGSLLLPSRYSTLSACGYRLTRLNRFTCVTARSSLCLRLTHFVTSMSPRLDSRWGGSFPLPRRELHPLEASGFVLTHRRTTRQTAHHRSHHLDGYPNQVTIVRLRHPFEGSALDVLGWCHRRGELHLTLVLSDGTRALVPAAWTDLPVALPTPRVQRTQAASLASRAQLLHARTVLNALLRRVDAANTAVPSPSQEDTHAAAELPRTPTPARLRPGMGRPRRGAARPSRTATRPTDRPSNRHTRRPRR